MKKILAYCFHERERDLTGQLLQNPADHGAIVTGDVDESQLQRLQESGIIFRVLDDKSIGATATAAEEANITARPLSMVERAGSTPEAAEPGAPDFYKIKLLTPLFRHLHEQLNQLGVKLIERVEVDRVPDSDLDRAPAGAHYYTARLLPEQARHLSELPEIGEVTRYTETDTLSPAIALPVRTRARTARRPRGRKGPGAGRAQSASADVETEESPFDLMLHRVEDMPVVIDWLRDHRIRVVGTDGRKIRVGLGNIPDTARQIASLPEVAAVAPFVEPELHCDLSRLLLGIEWQGNPGAHVLPQQGDGQLIGIADTGIDDGHPAFAGKIVGVVARGRPGDWSDPEGHGTHVAACALGNDPGTASGSLAFAGAAPQARLFMQSLLGPTGKLSGLPIGLGGLFGEAYRNGVRVHNNSWGSKTDSSYTFTAQEVDEFVDSHRDMLIIFSAGNEGTGANCVHASPGNVDWLSTGSPATTKNGLTVGASRSNRAVGGYATDTYGKRWPARFPTNPTNAETISGDPESVAAFSSRGPCDDWRIKPDVMAPGTDILSAKSRLAPVTNFWGVHAAAVNYAYDGGTSMAAPLVSGCAALVREYYMSLPSAEAPSAALLKATLINGTKRLTGPSAIADHPDIPNYHQGFGAVHMPYTIPNPLEAWLKLVFVDAWRDPGMQVSNVGDLVRFNVQVEANSPFLRVCLAYTDLPNRALQNDLNLLVEDPQGTKFRGNAQLPNALTAFDSENNIEIVRIESPAEGVYRIQVVATNILKGPQDYALVVTGALNPVKLLKIV
jgi:Subtilisin-like serine proteases